MWRLYSHFIKQFWILQVSHQLIRKLLKTPISFNKTKMQIYSKGIKEKISINDYQVDVININKQNSQGRHH